MRQVKWTDGNGYKRLALVRDSEPDSAASRVGIAQDPPSLDKLDWDAIKREIHNLLVERGLITWQDVQASGSGVSSIIVTVMKRRLIDLYKLEAKQ